MTLVEVVAGLVLLTTVLAAVGIARGRFVRQWADADVRLRAVRAADALLAEWLAGPADRVPVGSSGVLAGPDQLRWATRRVRDPAAGRLGADVVRLEITRPPGSGTDGGRPDDPVLVVEFLLRDGRPAAGANGEAAP